MEKEQIDIMNSELENSIKETEITEIDYLCENDQLPKGNKAYSVNCSVLFVDLRNSTYLTKAINKKNMVIVYKSLTRIVTRCAEDCGGEIRQICGDSFMLLFEDEFIDDTKILSGSKAFDCIMTINTYIIYTLIDFLKKKGISDNISVGAGIRTGSILMTKVGIRGKDKYQMPVFPGNITNLACKLCNVAKPGELLIDQLTYNHLDKKFKDIFSSRTIDSMAVYSTTNSWKVE